MSWLSSFRRFRGRGSPGKPAPRPDPFERPEPSCFAKGLDLSLRTEPQAWEELDRFDHRSTTYRLLRLKHSSTGVILFVSDQHSGGKRWVGRDDVPWCLIDADAALLLATLEANPRGYLKGVLDAERAEAARRAGADTHFAKLGCP